MSHTPRRRWLKLAAATFMATVGVVAATAVPAQAVSVYEGNVPDKLWTGSGGVKYRCSDDARTVREAYWPGGGPLAVELRYSPRCRAVWARAGATIDVIINSYRTNGAFRISEIAGKNPTASSTAVHWTVMLDDAGLLGEACIGWWGSGYETMCTGRY